MIIKRHQNKNDYCLVKGGLWVRDFTKKYVIPADINNLITSTDIDLVLDNELQNSKKMLQPIETEHFTHPKIAIIADGHNFDKKHHLVELLPDDVKIIGVNGSLNRWQSQRKMHYYVTNSPYESCINYLPKEQKVWPRCIASCRTNHVFVKSYNGIVYLYHPVVDEHYSGVRAETHFFIDDYRNAICAAIGLSYGFEVKKLLLLCLDDFYEKQRPATIEIGENKWIYPQQKTAHDLVDANLYWLGKAGIKMGYHCDGLEYASATYITEDKIKSFFEE